MHCSSAADKAGLLGKAAVRRQEAAAPCPRHTPPALHSHGDASTPRSH